MTEAIKQLYIETSSRCNINCRMCMRGSAFKSQGDMELSLFNKLTPVFPGLKFINFSGIGEPLLNPGLFEMLRIAKRLMPRDGETGFTTNGMLIDREIAGELVSSGLDKIVISIDGINPETYGYIRRGGDFERIKRGIGFLNSAKEKIKKSAPKIGIEFVVMRRTLDELPLAIEFARENNIEFVIVSHLLPYSEEMVGEVVFELFSQESIDVFESAKIKAEKENINFNNYYNFSFFRNEIISKDYMKRLHSLINQAYEEANKFDIFLNLPKLLQRNGKDFSKAKEIFEKTQSLAKKLNIELSLPPINSSAKRECKFIKNRACFVSWDGDVSPCIRLMYSHKFQLNGASREVCSLSLGNVKDRDINEIWNTPKFTSLRESVDQFVFPHCPDCPAYGSCGYLDRLEGDCFGNEEPCGDCLWGRNMMQCL